MKSAAYWNDEEQERGKPYWIQDVSDQRLLKYLRSETNLLRCFEDGLTYADREFRMVRGIVLDLAAGVCWTTAVVSRWPDVKEVHAFDFSEHRLCKIAPLVIKQLNGVLGKVHRHRESMYPLARADQSADLVIFCQALYMTDEPTQVMREVHRVLRPGGVVMISCERIEESRPPIRERLRRTAATMCHHPVAEWRQALSGRLPDISGRHPYRDEDYERFIINSGFRFARQSLTYAVLKASPVPAANYFGVKA